VFVVIKISFSKYSKYLGISHSYVENASRKLLFHCLAKHFSSYALYVGEVIKKYIKKQVNHFIKIVFWENW